ncbi:MAG: DUF1257 domain-containing protein [Chloroflexi bacterium]|nr:DUF1257 domain-containing protein [Chloroflexota bacterium]
MSKYLVYEQIAFKDRRLLLAALAELGYGTVEEGEALSLYGYQGDRRPETAEVVVRRQHLAPASNDLGFARTAQGYVPVISEYDGRTLLGGQLLVKLRTAYGERVVEEVRRRLNGTARRAMDGHLIKIRVRY